MIKYSIRPYRLSNTNHCIKVENLEEAIKVFESEEEANQFLKIKEVEAYKNLKGSIFEYSPINYEGGGLDESQVKALAILLKENHFSLNDKWNFYECNLKKLPDWLSDEEILKFREITGLKFHEITEDSIGFQSFHIFINNDHFENLFRTRVSFLKESDGIKRRKPIGIYEKIQSFFGKKFEEENIRITEIKDYDMLEFQESEILNPITDAHNKVINFTNKKLSIEHSIDIFSKIYFDGMIYDSLENEFTDAHAAVSFIHNSAWLLHAESENTIYVQRENSEFTTERFFEFISLFKRPLITFKEA